LLAIFFSFPRPSVGMQRGRSSAPRPSHRWSGGGFVPTLERGNGVSRRHQRLSLKRCDPSQA